jgi:hypothetical protein
VLPLALDCAFWLAWFAFHRSLMLFDGFMHHVDDLMGNLGADGGAVEVADQLGTRLPAFEIAEGALIPGHFLNSAIMRLKLVVGANRLDAELASGKIEIVGQHSFERCDRHKSSN